MNTRVRFCLLFSCGLAAAIPGRLVADAPAAGVIALGADGWRTGARADLAVTSGSTLAIDLLIPASMDRAKLRLDLRQVAGSVILPLAEARPLAEFIDGKAPDEHGITTVRIPFPALKRKTAVIVRIGLEGVSRPEACRLRVLVFPSIDWAPLARRLREDGPRVLVFGRAGGLRAFLREKGIEFSDNGDSCPGELAGDTLAIGALSAGEWAGSKDSLSFDGGSLVVFVDDPFVPPGLYATAPVTKVTLPVLATLARDPRGEELLHRLIEQSVRPASGVIP